MAATNPNVISDFLAQAKTQQQPQVQFAQRRATKTQRVLQRTQNLLATLIQLRNDTYNDFWGNSDGISPRAVAAELGPAKAASLFAEDRALVDFLAARLTAAGATPEDIAQLLPGVPDNFEVVPTPDGTGVVINDKV